MMGMVATKTGRMVVTMEKEMAKVVLAVMAKAVVVQWIRMTAPSAPMSRPKWTNDPAM